MATASTCTPALASPGWGIRGRPVPDAMRSMMATDCRYIFLGHMHDPRLYNLSSTGKIGDFVPTAGGHPVPPHRQWLMVPGSAGQPRDGNPAACYAVFDDAAGTLTYHRVPYDHDATGAKILAANPATPGESTRGWTVTSPAAGLRRFDAGRARIARHWPQARSSMASGSRRLHIGGMAALWRVTEVVTRPAAAADHEGAARWAGRGSSHHHGLRGRADDHADARRAGCAEVRRQRADFTRQPTSSWSACGCLAQAGLDAAPLPIDEVIGIGARGGGAARSAPTRGAPGHQAQQHPVAPGRNRGAVRLRPLAARAPA